VARKKSKRRTKRRKAKRKKKSRMERVKFKIEMSMPKQTYKLILFMIGIFIIASVVVYFAIFGKPDTIVAIPDLLTVDYSEVIVQVTSNEVQGVIGLTSGCKQIIAYTEPDQALSIYRGMEDITAERPNAHDLTMDAFNALDIDVLMAKIITLQDNKFYGRLIIRKGNKLASLDARPSDATAIALRADAPIYVKDDIIQSQGQDIC